MVLLFLALSSVSVVAFNATFDRGIAEERFSFDGFFDRIEHGYGHHHSKGINGDFNFQMH